jgi:hypothetical protein
MSNSTDFSYIKTIEDLRAMQVMVKLRIKEREKDLAERLQKVPEETFKATVGAIVPAFLNNKVAGTTMAIVKAAIGLLFRKKSKRGDAKDNLLSYARQLGIFSLLRAAYNLWKKK